MYVNTNLNRLLTNSREFKLFIINVREKVKMIQYQCYDLL